MGRRSLVISFVVIALMLTWASSASAAEGRSGTAQKAKTDAEVAPPGHEVASRGSNDRGRGRGPSEKGRVHAAANAARGMNRHSPPGEWNENGHEPAAPSFPQGKAPSDPDADANGGMDKPGGVGGFDADKDGNNGCGNDADREDDNNGWCGKPPHAAAPGPEGPPPGDGDDGTTPPAPVDSPPAITPPSIVGPTIQVLPAPRRTAPGALPRTGVDVSSVFLAGWGLTLAGIGMRARPRRRYR